FGNVGSVAALLMARAGARVVAITDAHGGVRDDDGIDVAELSAWSAEHGGVAGFPGATAISNRELLEMSCDILVPAAIENQITDHNAARIGARLIVEGANGPTTPEADRILEDRGIRVIPD